MPSIARVLGLTAAALMLVACGSAAPDTPVVRTASQQISARSETTSSTTSTSTTTTSTTIAQPTRALHKVLLLGDSEMYDAAPFATEAFKAAGIEVNSQAFPGTSLIGGTRVAQTFPTVLAEEDPDAIVMLYTGVYFPPLAKTADGRDIELATPEFFQAWTDAAVNATRELTARGARVYWVLLPSDDIQWQAHDTRMSDAYLAVRNAVPGVGYIDWRHTAVSAANGAPLVDAPIGPDGALEPVRAADGHHFSTDASHVLAGVMVQTVLHDFGAR